MPGATLGKHAGRCWVGPGTIVGGRGGREVCREREQGIDVAAKF